MAYEALQAVVGMAIVDSTFRRNLLNKAPDVLSDLGLTSEEVAAIEAVQARTFSGFASELQVWINRQTVPQMSSFGR